jgi:hypothetical protein
MSETVTAQLAARGTRSKPDRTTPRRQWVFTEQGVAMLSSVLRSDTAVRVNIEIRRAFVRLRRASIVSQQMMSLIEDVSTHVVLTTLSLQTWSNR